MKKYSKRLFAFALVLALLCSLCSPVFAYQQVQNGSQGNDVKTMQTMLNAVMKSGLTVDGICGAKSVAAIKDFQRAYGLTVDGICGQNTWKKLEEAYNKINAPSVPSTPSTQPNTSYKVVQNGSQGSDVKTMQTMLNAVMDAGLTVDGVCGAKSVEAIKKFQKACGLTADGICGQNTWKKLKTMYDNGEKISTKCTSHKKGTFVYADTAHPHKQYYKCANCGTQFTDGSTKTVSTCKTCNPPAQPSTSYSVVQNGSQGSDVKTMQTMLNAVMDAGLTVDGVCGAKSVEAIKKFQKACGLTADGICGQNTWKKLKTMYDNGEKISTKCTSHKKGTFVYADTAHPHKQYYKCANCGTQFTDGSTKTVSTCTTCNPPAQPTESYKTIRNGSQGSDVKTMQTMLNKVMNAGLSVDGICGAKSVAAIRNFQEATKLTVTGECDSKTWERLEKAYKNGESIAVQSSITIGNGTYAPGSLRRGQTYSISGKITSKYRLTNVTVGIYNADGSKTDYVKTISPNTTTYEIKNVDGYMKFGELDGNENGKIYYFKVVAIDENKVSKILVNNKFTVTKKNCKYAWPLPGNTTITSYFTGRIHPLTGKPSKHSGIDIGADRGTKVCAAEAGTLYVGCNSCSHNYGKQVSCGCGGGYGNYVYIVHDDGMRSYYAHLTDILVTSGRVSKGTAIGTVGSTGSSTGNHLHFEMRTGASSDSRVDPLEYTQP